MVDIEFIIDAADCGYGIHGAYEGDLKDGLPHGYGRLDSLRLIPMHYQGEWKDGLTHGRGEIVTPTDYYVGEFYNGAFHGQGTLTI